MPYSATHTPTLAVDVIEIWAKKARQQSAAFDAVAEYLGKQ